MIERRRSQLGKNKSEQRVSVEPGGHHIFLVFGDISGFRVWTRRIGHASKSFKTLMEPCIQVWLELEKKGYSLKLLGDGFMAVKEMKPDASTVALNVLEDAWKLTQQTQHLIDASGYPRPDGFRVRISSGEVAIVKMKKGIDFLGYMVNTTKDLLEVEFKTPCIVHESVKELLNPAKTAHIDFKKVKVTAYFRGIEKNDLDALWAFNINDLP